MILALQTATESGGVALLEGGRVLGERDLGPEEPHAGSLLVALDGLLRQASRRLEEVELIALSIGPGSFTGLRIGLATALGLCFGTSRRIVPVPTLAALSLQAGNVHRIVPLLDARKKQVYTGLYGSGGVSIREDRVCNPEVWFEELRGQGSLCLDPVHSSTLTPRRRFWVKRHRFLNLRGVGPVR
jgi:tRNA threonylcarbamoyladenosine biosynthesis protein TsaB